MASTIDDTKPLTNSLVTSSVLRALAAAAKFDIEALQTAIGGMSDPLTRVLTGFTASTGTITAADTILSAIEKLYGNKDVSNGYAGLTLFKINFKNAADTFTSFLNNTNTAARTYTFPDKDITVAGLVDLVGKNLLLNPAFTINQRAVSGTVTLAGGVYGHDRWKAGASGCTYTFATVNGLTTITITAGSLIQIIEDVNIPYGVNTHTLSWVGTAQGKVAVGSYSSSGVTASITGGVSTQVEFNTGTLTLVQLELGNQASKFEQRAYHTELSICKRYFEVIKTETTNQGVASGVATSGTSASVVLHYVQKCKKPTITFSAGWLGADGATNVSSTLSTTIAGLDRATLSISMVATISSRAVVLNCDAVGRTITLEAEL